MEIENEKICTCIAQILHLLNSLIITFLDDDKTETGQSFVYIDGFLVKSITINILLLISKLTK
ncbi:CEI_1a_G0043340.mRNA.1.CDS.1 [Saccharomyces cerevisiae]|nr:CEI_1a_G0043340.mRNA.1.CDS.1 [Saccharomyces cerevisiae]CAI7414977.1 CEI_1a_G0043340.mRNA.1.CDS.1 [Saccharomyces cerevisiae]